MASITADHDKCADYHDGGGRRGHAVVMIHIFTVATSLAHDASNEDSPESVIGRTGECTLLSPQFVQDVLRMS